MQRRTLLNTLITALGALALTAGAALAQGNYPDRTIKIMVGYNPGGSTDIVARLMADKLTQVLKQTVIVENRAGAGGNIATDLVARAEPDGYTLLMGATASIVINPSLYKSMSTDPAKDLAPVTLVQSENNLMVVTPSMPVKSVKEFIEYAKANPGTVTFASPGAGSPAHLAGELMNQMAGLNMLHVPYKGTSAAVNDLLAGHVKMAIDNMPALLPQVKAGKLRALAVAGETRSSAAPDIPTIQEAGLPGFVVPAWKGLLAPKDTPKPIIDKLQAAVASVLKMPDVRERMTSLGAEPAGTTPEQFGKQIKDETVTWAKLVKATGTTID